ncbi:MAG: glycoside hydrolase family 38 C-terminal domain-containing protein [Acidobacteriota bacterium]
MKMTRSLVALILSFPLLSLPAGAQSQRPGGGKDTLWYVPHTHWEGAVFKTRDEYLEMGLPILLRVFNMLKRYPSYKFTLDQAAFVKPFLDRYPEEEANLRRFVSEGRLQLAGGMNIMPDVNMPGGESFVRQVMIGKGFFRDRLGVDIKTGWCLDSFGHHAQMPQILKLCGMNSYWFFRGVASREVPSEFQWQGIDGTKISAFWLPYGYAVAYGSPGNLPGFETFFREVYDGLKPFARGNDLVGLAGADVSEPEEHLPRLVEEFNRKSDAPFQIRIAVASEFEKAVAQRPEQPVVTGELNPIFQGIYSSRIEVKQWIRSLETLLTGAEKLGAIENWLGGSFDLASAWRAWEPMTFNQTHDLASGVMVDKVYDDTLRGYEFAQRLGKELVQSSFESLVSKIDTRGEGIPVVVFNPLGWARTDVVEVEVGISEPGALALALIDPEGQKVPLQLTGSEQHGDGGIRRTTITFVAANVPAFGYSLYRVLPKSSVGADGLEARPGRESVATRMGDSVAQHDTGSIENNFYRATFNMWTGELTSLRDKASNWESLSASANVVAKEHDGGDFWELYGNLHGGRNIAMVKKHMPPRAGEASFSSEQVGGSGRIREGSVFSEYAVSHPFGSGQYATRVRLYQGVRRVDIRTEIFNDEKFVRYRALFPTTIRNGRNTQEIPFGAIERPIGVEFPAQNWIDYGDGSKGVALLNHGLPGNNVGEDTLMLSLMRSARIQAYAYHGGYEPGVSSDTGLEVGKHFKFDYALVPHSGGWREAGIARAGHEFNHPLRATTSTSHAGPLPKKWGLLEVSHASVLATVLKPSKDGSTVIRVYESSGKPISGVKIKFNAKVMTAEESNLLEDDGQKLSVSGDSLAVELGAYQIKTFKVRLQPFK